MDHPLLGTITYDREEEGWVGKVSLPAMARWRARHRLFFGLEEDWDTDDPHPGSTEIPATIMDPKKQGPSAAQDAALRYLIEEPDRYARSILCELARFARMRIDDERPTDPEEQKQFDATIKRLRLDQPEGAVNLVELTGIYVLKEAKAGQSWLTFEFGACGLDDEHGASVLVHAGNALALSGAAEFMGREDLDWEVENDRDSSERALATAKRPFDPTMRAAVRRSFKTCTGSIVRFLLQCAGAAFIVWLLVQQFGILYGVLAGCAIAGVMIMLRQLEMSARMRWMGARSMDDVMDQVEKAQVEQGLRVAARDQQRDSDTPEPPATPGEPGG